MFITFTGSLGYETQDAEQYAYWGVDYLKYDDCNHNNLTDQQRYTTMRNALNATGKLLEIHENKPSKVILISRQTNFLFPL